ncbi:DUF2264 domain-containing protein [Pedobacter sp. SD-b]|uniref:DUF2264 domain-containing protein n=1 Tax=Pedobacter segetis TaxID=2793069 RepID=A0ABS1BJ63_9SPHI|nr:DUF2264 domain-containing protein [Pedobacter segetis]MBK0382892.1 DUF2264 domain-containing protein [Pedobacter segetis]
MFRRKFLSFIPVTLATSVLLPKNLLVKEESKPKETRVKTNLRAYWVATMVKIAHPVLSNLSVGTLHKNMPVEINPNSNQDRSKFTHLEAFGRLLAGIAPWLELGADNSDEGKIREKYINLAQRSISNATDPNSPDFMNFTGGRHSQALVDSAFFAHGLLRAPNQLWHPLPKEVKVNVITAFKATRAITPGYNNWLLFMAMIEAFLLEVGEEGDLVRIEFAVNKHLEWYKGDGVYGDGKDFHFDYYNSFVIHPMMVKITEVLKKRSDQNASSYETALTRAVRYATIEERLISPEGSFPPVGRSLAYRFGAMQCLSMIAQMKKLPNEIDPAQVREGLSLVIKNMIEPSGTFDENGWLQIGFAGHQPHIAELYISTGSLYLCSVGMLPLGLPQTDAFWSNPPVDWTAKKAWSGVDISSDHAI